MLNLTNFLVRRWKTLEKTVPRVFGQCEISSNSLTVSKAQSIDSKHFGLSNKTTLQPAVYSSNRRFCSQEEGDESATSFHVQDMEDFNERVLNSDRPVVVDFFADWCGPCKLLAPRLESMVDNKGGEILLAKVDVDDCTELAMKYDVSSVPTVIGFKNGHPVDKFVGLTEDEQINSFLNKLTNS